MTIQTTIEKNSKKGKHIKKKDLKNAQWQK
jgi:hypothetical protein